MNKQTLHLNRKQILLVVLALAISSIACQILTQPQQKTSTQVTPVAQEQPKPKTEKPGQTEAAPSPGKSYPEGGLDLADPLQGIDAVSSYHLRYSLTVEGTANGNPYKSKQVIEQRVTRSDAATWVADQATGSPAVYFTDTRLGGYRYTQEREGAACRAEIVEANEPVYSQPVSRLPAAFGMQEAGHKTLYGVPVTQYTFDERSLVDNEGAVQKAEGWVWIADQGGMVIGYDLTAALQGDHFSGTYHWSYELSQVNQEITIRLPDGCQPLLADLPQLPVTGNALNYPGFRLYLTKTTRSEAVAFFYEQLTALGWTALPGSAPDQAELSSATTVISFAQPYYEGGRVLVIQLSENEGALQVIQQTAITKQPVESDIDGMVTIQPGEGERGPTAEQTGPGSVPGLPEDLPLYPGAKIITQMESMIYIEVEDPSKDVTAFYLDALEKTGWTLDQKVENDRMTSFMWSKDGHTLVVTIQEQGDVTNLSIIVTE